MSLVSPRSAGSTIRAPPFAAEVLFPFFFFFFFFFFGFVLFFFFFCAQVT